MESKNNVSQKWLLYLIIPAIIGMIASLGFYLTEEENYNNFKKEYRNHTHWDSCYEFVCGQEEHTHSSLCRDFDFTDGSYRYCSKDEHTHDDSCYELDCEYDKYTIDYTASVVTAVISIILFAVAAWLYTSKSYEAIAICRHISNDSNNFFNEKSDIWIRKLKHWTIIIFYLELIGFVVLGISDATNKFTVLGSEFGYSAFAVWTFIGLLLAFLTKTINMLVLQFLNNINTIREKIELISVAETDDPKEAAKSEEETEEDKEDDEENNPENDESLLPKTQSDNSDE